MIEYVLLGVIQGLTEFIPVSSSAHLILARSLWFGSLPEGLAVDALLQLASVCAVIAYFRRDLTELVVRPQHNAALLYSLAVATVPAVLLGLMLESLMESTFRDPWIIVYTLLIGAVFFFAAERSLERGARVPLTGLSLKGALLIGLFQASALVPGMSRSGMTASAGLFAGLTREAAFRFSFLLSVPILLGTGIKKLVDLLHTHTLTSSEWLGVSAGALTSLVVSFAVIHVLMKTVSRIPLTWFALYRAVLAGVLVFVLW